MFLTFRFYLDFVCKMILVIIRIQRMSSESSETNPVTSSLIAVVIIAVIKHYKFQSSCSPTIERASPSLSPSSLLMLMD